MQTALKQCMWRLGCLVLCLDSDSGTGFLKIRYFISSAEKEIENKYQEKVVYLKKEPQVGEIKHYPEMPVYPS